jgi:hypothetical protein
VFGVAAGQSPPRTRKYATVIAPTTEAASKRARELESGETLGSSDGTLMSDDETFLPNKLRGGAAAACEEYSFEGNKLQLSSLRRNDNISDSPFLERRDNKEPDTPNPTKVLFKDPPDQVLGLELELYTISKEMSPIWNKYLNQYSDGFFSLTLFIAGGGG